jgi:hypothetical protein
MGWIRYPSPSMNLRGLQSRLSQTCLPFNTSKNVFQEETALAESANGAQLPERDLDDQSVEMVRNIFFYF